MEHKLDFPKPISSNRFGKSVSLHSRNNCSLLLRKYEGCQTIDDILKAEGFATLPRRTKQEKLQIKVPNKIGLNQSRPFKLVNKTFFASIGCSHRWATTICTFCDASYDAICKKVKF